MTPNVSSCRLVSPSDAAAWDAFHRIRRSILFERRGLHGVYDAHRPDDRAPGNHPKLLLVGESYVGVVRIDLVADTAYLRRLAIDEPWQRQGYGRMLIALAESFVREHGVWRVESDVANDAVEFYRKCGYAVARPESGAASVRMYKQLRGA